MRLSEQRFLINNSIFLLLLVVPDSLCMLTVLGNDTYKAGTYESSIYIHFGPRSSIIRGKTVFLREDQLCNPPQEMVRGHIVLSDRQQAMCTAGQCSRNLLAAINAVAVVSSILRPLTTLFFICCPTTPDYAYSALDQAGALAVVFFAPWPTGIMTCLHDNWRHSRFRRNRMTWIHVSTQDLGKDAIEVWNSGIEIEVEISPHHSRVFEHLFFSSEWFFLIQIILPLFALLASISTFNEARRVHGWLVKAPRSTKVPHTIAFLACVIEGCLQLAIGFVLSSGYMGPALLPNLFYSSTRTLFAGYSSMMSVLMALLIREELRAFKLCAPRRSTLLQYRTTLIASTTFFVLADLIPGIIYLAMSHGLFLSGAVLLGIMFTSIFVVDLAVAAYFIFQLMWVIRPLYKFILPADVSHPHRNASREVLAKVVLWLSIAAASMIIFSISSATLLAIFFSSKVSFSVAASSFLPLVFFMGLSRIVKSFAQIKAVAPMRSLDRFVLRCGCSRRRQIIPREEVRRNSFVISAISDAYCFWSSEVGSGVVSDRRSSQRSRQSRLPSIPEQLSEAALGPLQVRGGGASTRAQVFY